MTIIRTVLIIATRLDVAMEVEATAMEAMEMEVSQITMWFEGRFGSFVLKRNGKYLIAF